MECMWPAYCLPYFPAPQELLKINCGCSRIVPIGTPFSRLSSA